MWTSLGGLGVDISRGLGVDISKGLSCPLCTDIALDPLGQDHHAATCRQGG